MTSFLSSTSLPSTARRTRGSLPACRSFVALAAVGLVLALATAACACPGCKDALNTGEYGGDLRAGFFWSILFMLSMPPLILAGLGTAMYRSVRRARAAQAAGRPLAPAVGGVLHAAGRRDGPAAGAPLGTTG